MKETGGWAEVVVAAVVALTVVSLAVITRGNASRGRRLPPGPRGWPILGSLLSLGKLPHQALYQLSKQYGPCMFMYFGSVKTLVVTSPQLAEEILKTQDQIMASRPDLIVGKLIFYDRKDIGLAPYGEQWRYGRKLCAMELLTTSRLAQFQEIRQREVLASVHSILEESQLGKAVNMSRCFSILSINNITQMIMNKSYCGRRQASSMSGVGAVPGTSTFEVIFQDIMDLVGAFNLADYVPIMKLFDLQGLEKRMTDVHRQLDKFLEVVIEEHRQKQFSSAGPTLGNPSQDFVDVLLAIGSKTEREERLSLDTIKALLTDMLTGASDTSSVAAEWALAELLRHPRAMSRVQEELDLVVGRNRLVTEADVPQLKYLQAVVKETLRLHPPAALLTPHESTQDCEIAGYHIPARTRVYVNVWGIQRDPTVWERPLEFDPERFLSSTIDVKGQDFGLLPFGSGRRKCPGLDLGLLMVQYPLAHLIHVISWSLPEDQKPEAVDMSESFGMVVRKAVPVTVFAKARLQGPVIYPTAEH